MENFRERTSSGLGTQSSPLAPATSAPVAAAPVAAPVAAAPVPVSAPAPAPVRVAATAPVAASPIATPAASTPAEASAAKAAWLNKLDSPSWGASAAASKAAAAASKASAAKAAWLNKLDLPSWGAAASALNEAAADASKLEDLTDGCESGDDEACVMMWSEEEARKAWLAKLDAPSWAAAAKTVSDIAGVVAAESPSEQAANAAKLNALDLPTLGKAASTLYAAVEDATEMANLLDECDVGNSIACLALSTEEEAKRAWLSKLEVSSWAKVAEAVKEVAEGVADRNGTPLVIPKTRSKKKAEKAEEAKAEVKSVKGVPWPRSTDGAPGGEFCAQGTRPTRKRMRLNARRERVVARLEARRASRAAKDAVMIEAFFEQKRRDASSGSANTAVADPSPVVADESSSASAAVAEPSPVVVDASSASAAVADASSSSYRVFDQVFQVWTDVGEIGRGGDGGREEQAVADEPAVELGGDFDELAVEVLGSDNPYEVFADAPFTEAKESSKRMIMELEGLKVALKGLRTLKKKLLATEL